SSSTQALLNLIYEEKLTPIFHTNFWSLKYVEGYGIAPTLDIPPDMPANTTIENIEFRQRWINHLRNISKNYKPAFYSIGNEVDLFYNYEPNRHYFDSYVSLVAESYDAIKSVSPHTKVMIIFKFENLVDKNTWFLIDKFDKNKIDLLGFTTYPYLIGYNNPNDIPLNYYSEISKHTGEKKVAFTEIGWSSSYMIGGNEKKQADFLSWFLEATKNIPSCIVCWLFLHDLAEEGKEKNVNELNGLRKNNGEPKEVWQCWKNLHDIEYKNNPPSPPIKPSGSIEGKINVKYVYSTFSTDKDGDCLFYLFDWGDGNKEWLGPFKANETANATHEWKKVGNYVIKVKVRDFYEESEWSESLIVSMPFYFSNIMKIVHNYIEIFGRVIYFFT
ncbi:MAG: PKD domain-containing protein, partial [Candidatus Thermoplasmatota archaeon]